MDGETQENFSWWRSKIHGEQAVAGFLPVPGGTLVVYSSHAFTEQVSGFGGSMMRGIGSSVMADQLKNMFEVGRTKAAQ